MAALILLFLVAMLVGQATHVLREKKRGVVFRLGRFSRVVGPGLVFTIPFLERLIAVDTSEQTLSSPVEKGDLICRFHVVDPAAAILNVANYQSALGEVVAHSVKEMFADRSSDLQYSAAADQVELCAVITSKVKDWGVKIDGISFQR